MAMGLTTFFTALFVSADRKFERRRSVLPGLHLESVRCTRARVDERERKNQPEEKTRGGHGGERGS
jgi:hypothetical protein